MEPKPGVVIRDVVPDHFGGGRDESVNRKLSTVVIDTLVELHSVDAAECGLEDLGHPDGFLERQVEGWWNAGSWQRTTTIRSRRGRRLASSRCRSRAPNPPSQRLALDNMAVSPADPACLCGGVRLGHGNER